MRIPQIIGVFLFFGLFYTANGQVRAGYDFYTVPSNLNELNENLQTTGSQPNNLQAILFYILAYENACIKVVIDGIDYTNQVQLAKDSLWVLQMPPYPEFEADSAVNLGVNITSTAPIGLYQGTSTQNLSSTLYNFHVTSNTLSSNDQIRQMDSIPFFEKEGSFGYWWQVYQSAGTFKRTSTVLSLEDSNQIILYYKVTGYLLNAGSTNVISHNSYDTIQLNKGEFYMVVSFGDDGLRTYDGFHCQGYAKSLNNKGLKVQNLGASSAIALVTDSTRLFNELSRQLPARSDFCWEDQHTLEEKDTLFYWPNLRGYQGTSVSLLAYENNTQVLINGQLHVLNTFERMDTSVAEALVIRSNKPLAGYGTPWPRYLDGRPITNTNVGSFTVTLSAAHELIKKARVPTLSNDSLSKHIFTLVTPARDTALLTVSGGQQNFAPFQIFSQDSAWCYTHVEVPYGIHNIESTGGFMGYYYTYRPYDSTITQEVDFTGNYGHNIPEYSTIPSDSFQVFMGTSPTNLLPLAQWANNAIDLCASDSLYYSFGAYRNINWQWLAQGDTLATRVVNGAVRALALKNAGSYFLTLVDSQGCRETDSIAVEVLETLSPIVNYQLKQSCTRNLLELSVEGPLASYEWFFPDGTSQTGSDAAYDLSPNQDSIQIKLVQNLKGCLDTLVETILFDSINNVNLLEFPNVITPNADGVNDELCFATYSKYQGCFKVSIFNRDGTTVYKSNNTKDCWRAQGLATSVYFYEIEYGGKIRNGFIHIMP